MDKSSYTILNPKNIDQKLMLDANSKIILSKSDNDYILTIELPNGKLEKYSFAADTEYMVKYDRHRNENNSRALIGDLTHIVTEFV